MITDSLRDPHPVLQAASIRRNRLYRFIEEQLSLQYGLNCSIEECPDEVLFHQASPSGLSALLARIAAILPDVYVALFSRKEHAEAERIYFIEATPAAPEWDFALRTARIAPGGDERSVGTFAAMLGYAALLQEVLEQEGTLEPDRLQALLSLDESDGEGEPTIEEEYADMHVPMEEHPQAEESRSETTDSLDHESDARNIAFSWEMPDRPEDDNFTAEWEEYEQNGRPDSENEEEDGQIGSEEPSPSLNPEKLRLALNELDAKLNVFHRSYGSEIVGSLKPLKAEIWEMQLRLEDGTVPKREDLKTLIAAMLSVTSTQAEALAELMQASAKMLEFL